MTFLFLTMDDDNRAHPEYLADDSAVLEAVKRAVYYYREGEQWDPEHLEQCKGITATLLDDGKMTFEGDPPLYLFRLPDGAHGTAQCPACNGYGRVNDGSGARSPYGPKCPKCGGSGRVPDGVTACATAWKPETPCWLVERRADGRTTGYLGHANGSYEWMPTPDKATRFVRREDANGVAECIETADVIVAEHIWG